MKPVPESLVTLGWREWVGLPGLGIRQIKAKIDTGARTSALHAFEIEEFEENGKARVRFKIHPVQRDNDTVIECVADVVDQRIVSDSGGHKEMRLVIETTLLIGGQKWPIEMTLTNRDSMRFRMLLGRTAMSGRSVIYPEASYLAGEPALRTEK